MNAWGIQFNHNKDPQSNDRFIKSYHADWYSIPGSGRSAGEGIGYPLQHSWASLVSQLVKNPPAMWATWVRSLGWEDPGEGKGYPLQYSGLENSKDCIVHGAVKSRTRLSDFHFTHGYGFLQTKYFVLKHPYKYFS